MDVLNRETEIRDYVDTISNANGINWLKEKLKSSFLKNAAIVVVISNTIIECRNTFEPDEYDVDENCISLINSNYELYINLDNEMTVSYDNYEDQIILSFGETEISFYFLE